MAISDVFGILGFLLAVVLAAWEFVKHLRPRVRLTLNQFYRGATLSGVVLSFYNLGARPLPIERVGVGKHGIVPGTMDFSPLYPDSPAVGPFGRNPRTPCVVQPGEVLTWLASVADIKPHMDESGTLTVRVHWCTANWFRRVAFKKHETTMALVIGSGSHPSAE